MDIPVASDETGIMDAQAIELNSALDEVFDQEGKARPAYAPLLDNLATIGIDELVLRCEQLLDLQAERGITYSYANLDVPFPLDPIPRIIEEAEWNLIARGVAQRVTALQYFLDDVYSDQMILFDRIIPRELVVGSKQFLRQVHGIKPVNGTRIHVCGTDIVRGHDGKLYVLEDNLRVPSGASYVIENRRTMAQWFPELFNNFEIAPVASYPAELLEVLRSASPSEPRREATVVLLTPGPYNAAYFEHAFLARRMGIPLVEPSDIYCSGTYCYLRSSNGSRRVDVIYRRIDDAYLDPVCLDPGSLLGIPGLLAAVRANHLTVANALGNGIGDDKLINSYVPDMIRYYLGEDPLLPNAPTYRLSDPDELAWVIDNIERLVVKPVDAAGGKGVVVCPLADEHTISDLRYQISRSPRSYIAQEIVNLSTMPTLAKDRYEPRHVDLRPFALSHEGEIRVMPGGLTRVSPSPESLIVNSSQGGGSKDTWVLGKRAIHLRIAAQPLQQPLAVESLIELTNQPGGNQ